MRVALILLLGLLAACTPQPAVVTRVVEVPVLVQAPPQQPAPELQPLVYIAPDPCGVPDEAIDLIIAFEVGSPEAYTRKYTMPVWPGGASGVTIGIGYDLGYRTPNVIALDWEDSPHNPRLITASGITGPIARDYARRMADISIAYGFAREVFDQTSVVEYHRLTKRAFGEAAYCRAPPGVRGALLSLVFNRGAAMAGDARAEMRYIRDVCLVAANVVGQCVAQQLRAMVRIWHGKDIERGMARRRDAEAAMAERAA